MRYLRIIKLFLVIILVTLGMKIPGHFLISEICQRSVHLFLFFFGFKIQRQDPVTFGSLRRVRDRTCSGCVLDEDKTLLFIHSSVPVLYCCVSTSVRTWVTLPQSLLQCKQIFTACLFPSHVLSNANFPSHLQHTLSFIDNSNDWRKLCL